MKKPFLAAAALLAGTVAVSMLTVTTAHAAGVDPERDLNDTHSPLTQSILTQEKFEELYLGGQA